MAQVLPGGLQEIPSTTPPVAVNGTGKKSPELIPPVAPGRDKPRTNTACTSLSEVSQRLTPENPDEVLWDAVCQGNCKQAALALERRADPNRQQMFDTSEFSEDLKVSARTSLVGRKNNTALKLKKYQGSLVSAAVMRGDLEMVRLLVEHGGAVSGPLSYYTFKAGLRKVDFEGPPTFCVFMKNEVRMIRELARLKANLSEKAILEGMENNTLLWNASYAGSKEMVQYLLNNTPEHLEVACVHQDDGTITHTPLHIASMQGHAEVVLVLLHRGARLKRKNEVGMTALTDAIDRDHAPVVKALVRHHADILSKDALHWLFRERNNMVTIEAAADGLKCFMVDEPELCQKTYLRPKGGGKPKLTAEHIVQFFNTPGDATMHIISVIFQKRTIRYKTHRVLEDGRVVTKRDVYKNAHIPPGHKFNVVVGPDVEHWNRKFETTQLYSADSKQGNGNQVPEMNRFETPKERRFKDTLLPQQDASFVGRGTGARFFEVPMQVPIDIYQCVLCGIHRDPEVLFAISEQDGDGVFKAIGVQAILELAWQAVWKRYTIHLVVGLIQCCLFFGMTIKINMHPSAKLHKWPALSLICMSLCWLMGVRQEVGQIFGYWLLGRLGGYLGHLENIIDWARLVLTGTVIYMLWWDHECFVNPESPNYRPFRQMLAVVVFFRWIRVLNACRGYKLTGPSMLPITRAFAMIYPFGGVVLFPLLGFFHAYYCFGIYGEDIYRTFSIVYRIGFVGDFDVEDMEDADGHYQTEMEDGQEIQTFNDPEQGIFWLSLRIFLICCTLWLTVAMMNIFIGVLSEAYINARQNSEEIFWRSRARIVFDEQAQIAAERALIRNLCRLCPCRCCKRCPGKLPRPVTPDGLLDRTSVVSITEASEEPVYESDTPCNNDPAQAPEDDLGAWDHVWYCCQAEGVAALFDGALDDDNAEQAVTVKDFEEMKEGMNATFKQLGLNLGKQGAQLKSLFNEMHQMQRAMTSSSCGPRAQTAPQGGNVRGGAVVRHHSEPSIRVRSFEDSVDSTPRNQANTPRRMPALAREQTAWSDVVVIQGPQMQGIPTSKSTTQGY